MAPVLVLRLALRGVSGFWLLHQVTTTRKRFGPGMRWTIWRRKQGEWPGPPWKGDPRCSQSPPAFRAAMQGGSSVDRSWQPSFLVPGWPHPSRELQLPLNQCQRVSIMSHACHGDGVLSLFAVDTMEGASATPLTVAAGHQGTVITRRKQGSQDWRCVC